jgi:hypothetical protein
VYALNRAHMRDTFLRCVNVAFPRRVVGHLTRVPVPTRMVMRWIG